MTGMNAHLVDFLPFEVADYVESQAFVGTSVLVVGPPGSGKSRLLTALVAATGIHLRLAGLSDLRGALPCLDGHGRSLSLHVPSCLRSPDANLPHLLNRQAVQVAIADDPSDQTWFVLADLIDSGISVWASTTAARQIPAGLVVQFHHSSGSVSSIYDGRQRLIYQAGPPGCAVFNPVRDLGGPPGSCQASSADPPDPDQARQFSGF